MKLGSTIRPDGLINIWLVDATGERPTVSSSHIDGLGPSFFGEDDTWYRRHGLRIKGGTTWQVYVDEDFLPAHTGR